MFDFGEAKGLNPFHNPYEKGELILPEMGWAWGGNWNTLKDWMHFSQNGH